MALFGTAAAPKKLDLTKRNPILDPLLKKMQDRLVGQGNAAEVLVDMVATHLSGFGAPGRPAGNALLLGPTGAGKTHAVEVLCEGLVGDAKGLIKVDCAEFQHSHEIAKLIGSPPGYLGHRETPPLLTQERINALHKEGMPLSVILFDEIEKASDALWQLLLGVLDKATLTLGDNRVTNFEHCIILMTSNLGAKEMHAKKYGFKQSEEIEIINDEKNEEIALSAAKKHFTAEFINRLDHIVTFNTLTKPQVAQVMKIELDLIQKMFWDKAKFIYQLTPAAKYTILEEGYSIEYGARNLKRVIEKRLRLPLAGLVSSGQISPGATLVIDQAHPKDKQFEFISTKLAGTNITFKDAEEAIL
jgi:ATP-dependent Clp protease ATP-binding subunit ClpA